MELRGRRIPMVFSLIVWFVLWEVIGRLGLISLIPPFSESIMAMAEVVPSETFIEAASIWILTSDRTGSTSNE